LALAWYIVEYTEEKIILVHEKEDERIEIKLII